MEQRSAKKMLEEASGGGTKCIRKRREEREIKGHLSGQETRETIYSYFIFTLIQILILIQTSTYITLTTYNLQLQLFFDILFYMMSHFTFHVKVKVSHFTRDIYQWEWEWQ